MLARIGQDIWAHEADIKLPGGMSLPGRSTIVRLADGQIVVCSPLPFDPETAKEVDALGDVRLLVAPNLFHWLYLKAAHERWPKARVLAPAGLGKKVSGLPLETLPQRGELARSLRVGRVVGAPGIDEHALLHEPSQSLILTDLMFNVHACRSLGMRLFLRLVGAWKRPAQSKVWRLLVKDRTAAAESAAELLAWDFDRIVVAHGDVIDVDARERGRHALAWMSGGSARLLGARGNAA